MNERALEAAIRECARITAPFVTDEIFTRERDDNSERYRNTRGEVASIINAYLSNALSGEVKDVEAGCRADAETLRTSDVFQGPLSAITSLERAADHLAALSAALEAERAEKEVQREAKEHARRECERAEHEITRLTAQVAEMGEALEPFGREADDWNEGLPDSAHIEIAGPACDNIAHSRFTLGDLRRARSARRAG